MYNPISTEFFDQLMVAMERQIPSKIEYYQNEEEEKKQEKTDTKALVKTMEVIDGFEFLVLDTEEKIRLSWVIAFNGKRYRED
ncbi:MAG: transcriptional antiterminator Rof [Sulfurovaceae bacterium]|nr:transcriptional antiterminator Rof [Sulfurovaceae bacterium]